MAEEQWNTYLMDGQLPWAFTKLTGKLIICMKQVTLNAWQLTLTDWSIYIRFKSGIHKLHEVLITQKFGTSIQELVIDKIYEFHSVFLNYFNNIQCTEVGS